MRDQKTAEQVLVQGERLRPEVGSSIEPDRGVRLERLLRTSRVEELPAVEVHLGFGESAERVGLGPEPLARQHTFPRDRMGVLGAPET